MINAGNRNKTKAKAGLSKRRDLIVEKEMFYRYEVKVAVLLGEKIPFRIREIR